MRKKQKIINLFCESQISSVKQVFSISDEDDLDQCWHYFYQNHSDALLLQDFVALFYEFSNRYIMSEENYFFELILETSEDAYFFTIWNKKASQALHTFLTGKGFDLSFEKKRLTVRVEKTSNKISEIEANEIRNKKILASIKSDSEKTKNILAYDFLEEEDLQELLVLCEDMQDIIGISKKHGFVEALFIRLRACFSMFSLLLRSYPQLSKVTNAITGFSALINTNQERFSELSVDEILLFEGFVYNIERWLKALFIEGGVQLTFMDNSLNADLETISSVIAFNKDVDPCHDNDLEAIFDF